MKRHVSCRISGFLSFVFFLACLHQFFQSKKKEKEIKGVTVLNKKNNGK
jgi:hypothetical protein